MKARLIQMNNQVIFAAAGNGKTYSLCSKAKAAVENGNKYVLLLSYTNEGIRSLENELAAVNADLAAERTSLSEYIKSKEKLYTKLRAKNQ